MGLDYENFNDVKEFLLSSSKYVGLLYSMRVLDSTAAQIMIFIIRVFSIEMLLSKHTQS